MKKKCKNKRCGRPATKGDQCARCHSREWRAANPERSAYNNLKMNAKRRGIPFDLSFEDFKNFCVRTEYIKGKGKKADSASVDRINDDPAKGFWGYRLDNLQRLSLSENTRKRHLRCYYDEQERSLYARVTDGKRGF